MNQKTNIKEQQLLDQCLKGNQLAQMQLYNQYCKAMYNVSMRILNDKNKAEDAMQEAFITAFKKLNHFKAEASFGAWLKKIVINKSIDLLNKKYNNNLRLDLSELNIASTTNQSNEPNYRIKQTMQQIMNLPPADRTIISLYYLEGYDHEEIANILNISYANSRTKLSRALNKLKETIDAKA